MSSLLRTTALLVLAHLAAMEDAPSTDANAAMDGRCTGCRNQDHANNIFDHLAFSVRYSERLSYLALDMRWLDRLLSDHAKVHITFHDFSKAALDNATAAVDELHYQVCLPGRAVLVGPAPRA